MKKTLPMAASVLLASICSAQAAPVAPAKQERNATSTQDAAPARVIMGIVMEEVDEALAQQLGVDPEAVVLIYDVVPDFGAEKAGIKKHDVIKAIDGQTPVSTEVVQKLLARKKPGDKVKITYIRGRSTADVEVELMAAKDTPAAAVGLAPAQQDRPGKVSAPQRTPAVAQRGAAEATVPVPSPTSWLWRAQDEEQLRSAVQRLREQLRRSEQDVSRHARDMAKESSALAEKLLAFTRDKALAQLGEEKITRLGDVARELAERSREKLEVEMRDLLEKHRDTLDKSMRDVEKQLGKLPSAEAVRVAREYTARAGQPGGGAVLKTDPKAGQPTQAAPLTTGHYFAGPNTTPLAVLGDGGKALKKVEDRLEGIEERLEKIEKMLEKLAGRAK